MRHKKTKYQLNRFTSWRKATLKSLARNLLIEQRIRTSRVKAKAVRPLVEQLVTLARKNTLFAKRRAASILNNDHNLVKHLFEEIGPRFQKRTGGYTRIINLGPRRGDNMPLVIFELTEIKEKPKKEKKKKEKSSVQEEAKPEKPVEENKPKAHPETKEKPAVEKKGKPEKKFFKGIKNIFKKERDSL